MIQELTPTFSSLVSDPFASHVIRALLSLLVPKLSTQSTAHGASVVRSKKSAAYKAKQGSFKSVFASPESDQTAARQVLRPGADVHLELRVLGLYLASA